VLAVAAFPARPRFRGTSHAVAAALAGPACLALLRRTCSPAQRAAVAGYGATMTTMFAISAAYHRGHWSPGTRRWLKAADHCAIFAFIAGSYGPLAVVVRPARRRWRFLVPLWLGCAAGSAVKVGTLDRTGGPADVWYAATTWAGLAVLPSAVRVLPGRDVALAGAGLVAYSLSGAALGTRRPDPWPGVFGYHEVAHLLALVGTVSHYRLYRRALAAQC